MKLILQRTKYGFQPFSDEDAEKARGVRFEQSVEVTMRTLSPEEVRSNQQNRALHACFQKVADNTDNPNLNTVKKVKAYVKLHCGFIESDKLQATTPCPKCKTPVPIIQWILKSLAFKKSTHREVTGFAEKAIPFIASILGCTEEELLENI